MATPVKYRNGLIGTILFHGGLLFFLLFMAFRTPLPLPEELGILVDFGNSSRGSGNFEPRRSDPAPVQPQQTAAQPAPQKESVLTQDAEETVALPSTPAPKPKPAEQETPKPAETPKPVAETPKPVERTVDKRALYPGRGDNASTATNQGEAGGQGNQGVSTGAPNVHIYGEGGDGGGSFSLSGRGLEGKLPLPLYKSQEQGKVIVEITVDKNGNVIDADAGVKGSTTLDKNLLAAALKAAKQAKFNRKPDAPVQKGTITYIFKLQGD
jgi:TonB family protein